MQRTPWITALALLASLSLSSCAGTETVPLDDEWTGTAESISDWPGFTKGLPARSGWVVFSGQPDADALREAKKRGVVAVINLRPQSEMEGLFDEAGLCEELGLDYHQIPVTPSSFSAGDVDRFAALLEKYERAAMGAYPAPVLVHCSSSNRVGGLWAAYLNRVQGVDGARALELGEAAGLSKPVMVQAAERVMSEQ